VCGNPLIVVKKSNKTRMESDIRLYYKVYVCFRISRVYSPRVDIYLIIVDVSGLYKNNLSE